MTLPGQPRPHVAPPNLGVLAAAKLIESHGPDALRILEERAELAEEHGHRIAAETWRDMAAAAARLLHVKPRVPHFPAAAVIDRQLRARR